MSGEELETVVDIDGIILGFVSSHGDESDESGDDYTGDLAVYDANYDFLGPARNMKIAQDLLRRHRADATPPKTTPATRRFDHSFW